MKTIKYIAMNLMLLLACQQAWSDIKDWYKWPDEKIIADCLADNTKMEQLIYDIKHAKAQNAKELAHLQSMLNSLHLNVSTASDKAHTEKAYQERDLLQYLYVVISAKQMAVDPTEDTAFLVTHNRELSDKIRAYASEPGSFKTAVALYAPLITPADYVSGHWSIDLVHQAWYLEFLYMTKLYTF